VGTTLGLIVAGRDGALVLAAAGVATPILILVRARDRRDRKLSEQMPDALDTMARSLRAGHAVVTALEFVATDMPEPICVEFGRAVEEQRLGLTLEQAVVHMTERLPKNADLKIFAVSTMIQKETGGNLAEILGNIARTIRGRYAFYGKLRALTGEGRASAVVLGSLPFVAAIAMLLLNPGYMQPLFTTPGGHALLAYAIASWGVGLLLMNRLAKLDY
jgi:tight adherence protein B